MNTRWLRKAYFRWVDRSLSIPVHLGDRDSMETGEWNIMVGDLGEILAEKYLWASGNKVLYRNFRAEGGGEVDIVFRDKDTLVFCEVKSRTSQQFGRPSRAVNRAKQRLIIRGANAWLRELNLPSLLFRFDVLEVLLLEGELPDIRQIENAFNTPQVGLGM